MSAPRVAGRSRSRKSPTQPAFRRTLTLTLPLTHARAGLREDFHTNRRYLTTLKNRPRRIDLNHSATPAGDHPPYAGSRDHHTTSARPLMLS